MLATQHKPLYPQQLYSHAAVTCSSVCFMLAFHQSHSTGEAHWDGGCGLSEEQQAVFLYRRFVSSDEQGLSDAVEEMGLQR